MNRKNMLLVVGAVVLLLFISACVTLTGGLSTPTAVPTIAVIMPSPIPVENIQPTEAVEPTTASSDTLPTECSLKAYPKDYPSVVVYLNMVGENASMYCLLMPSMIDAATMTVEAVDNAPKEPVSCERNLDDTTKVYIVGQEKAFGDGFCEGFNP